MGGKRAKSSSIRAQNQQIMPKQVNPGSQTSQGVLSLAEVTLGSGLQKHPWAYGDVAPGEGERICTSKGLKQQGTVKNQECR